MAQPITLAVASPSFSKNRLLRQKILNLFPYVKFCENKVELKHQELKNFLQGANHAIIGKEIVDAELLKQCPELCFIAKYGVGTDNIDFKACKEFSVTVALQEGSNKRSVAELSLGLMIDCLRKISLAHFHIKKGLWIRHKGFELTGKTIGIIGCGHVGTELIKLLKPFHCKLLLNDLKDLKKLCSRGGGDAVSKEEIYKKSDLISLHVPLTELTENLICTKTLALMKKQTILINTSRGRVVNLEDLKVALEHKRIAAAALDVFPEEPLPKNFSLRKLDNLVMTAHMGASTEEAALTMGEGAIAELMKFLDKPY